VKDARATLQMTIAWMKKKTKNEKQEWENAYIEIGMAPQKLKTPIKTKFASKVIIF
jgi:hypothetical protein